MKLKHIENNLLSINSSLFFLKFIVKYLFTVILMICKFSSYSYSQSLKYPGEVIADTNIFLDSTFNACHASTIAELSPGKFMAAWFAGSNEGANDVGIWTSVLNDKKWSTPIEVAKGIDSNGNQLPCWNPVLFKAYNNNLFLFYKVGVNPREWWGMVIQSTDDGKTWTEPQALPKNFLGPIKNKPIQLTNEKILCPSSVESIDTKRWTIHLEITDENLSAWKKIEFEEDTTIGVIQPTILQHKDGQLQMLCRSRQNVIYQTWSTDNGLSWTKLDQTTLPNPNSGIDAVTLNDGNFLLVYNPLLKGRDWFYGRNVLNVAISNDGLEWNDIYQLENEKDGEFSYPAVIQAADKTIHITYTDKRKNIKYVVLKLNK
jgi:alpha-L-fucosidase